MMYVQSCFAYEAFFWKVTKGFPFGPIIKVRISGTRKWLNGGNPITSKYNLDNTPLMLAGTPFPPV